MSPFTDSCPQPGDYAIRPLGGLGYSVRRVTSDDAWPHIGMAPTLHEAWVLAVRDTPFGRPESRVWQLEEGHQWRVYAPLGAATRDERLAQWARATLLRLEATIEWSADLLADIAADAQRAGLADSDDDGLFRVIH